MKTLTYFIAISLILVLLISCENEIERPSKDYPYIVLNTPNVKDGSIEFSADITNLGTEDIIKYGFIWYNEGYSRVYDSIIFDGSPTQSVFSSQFSSGFKLSEKYTVKAFVKTKNWNVYTHEQSFVSLGSIAPIIDDFSPKEGGIGTRVEITGRNFPTSKSDISVKLGSYNATIDSLSKERIIITVPTTVNLTEKVALSIESLGRTIVATNSFELWYPWTKLADFPGDIREEYNTFVINGKGYVCMGVNDEYDFSRSLWEYDPLVNKWSKKTDFPGIARFGAFSIVIGKKAYIGLGAENSYSGKVYNSIWEYDSESDKWSQKLDFPAQGRAYPLCYTINNKVYIGQGGSWYFDEGVGLLYDIGLDDFWEYDPKTNEWSSIGYFPFSPRRGALNFSIGEYYYFIGGLRWNYYYYIDAPAVYKFDPSIGQWDSIGEFPGLTYKLKGFVIEDKFYCGMNSKYDSQCRWLFQYDPNTNIWKQMQNWPLNSHVSFAFALGNKGYVGVGIWGYKTYPSFYEFDPTKN